MGLLDNLQQVAKKSEELAQNAAKKSGELLEITRLNIKIKEEERAIQACYTDMGKIIFNKYSAAEGMPDEFTVFVQEIQIKKETITNLQKKIEEIKKTEEYNDSDVTENDFVSDEKINVDLKK